MSGTPVTAPSRSLPHVGRDTSRQALLWTAAVSAAVIVAGALTIRPLAWSGRGLLVAVLLMVNSLLLLSRHASGSILPDRARIVSLSLAVVAAAALLGAAQHGTAYLFAFFAAGQAGFRLNPWPAALIALTSSFLCGGVLLVQVGTRYNIWTVGATTGLAVLFGMTRRSQQQALDSAVSAAQAAERAGAAEASNAVLAERSRIARDVHDVLAHSLAGINMRLELVDALLDTGDLDRVREATGKAQELVRESLKQAQWTVSSLRQDALPLPDTLAAMLESSGRPGSLAVVGTVRDVPVRQTQQLLRILQEALTNATRHAPGAPIAVTLRYDAATIVLEVRNGAATQPPAGDVGSGLGLVGMRERIALLGGTLRTGPITDSAAAGRAAAGGDTAAGGWRVEAEIPG